MVSLEQFRRGLQKNPEGKKEIPLFNLNIELKGWKGPFKDFYSFLILAKIARERTHLWGEHYVTSKGEIMDGLSQGLHTFQASMDPYQHDHLHYGNGGKILDLKDQSKIYTQDLPIHPIYTLQGLYETILADERGINSKIERLSQELKIGKFESIVRNPETKLKLLESKYRREISNQ